MSGLTKIFIVLQLVFSVALSVLLVLMVSKQDNYKAQVDAARTASIAQTASLAAAQTNVEIANAAVADYEKRLADAKQAAQETAGKLLATNASQQAQILDLQAQIASASTNISALTATNALASKLVAQYSDQLKDLSPKVSDLTNKYSEATRTINELTTQLRGSERAVRSLQEQIATQQQAPGKSGGAAAPNESGGQVASLSAATPTATQINGKVTGTADSAGRTLVETGLGSRDGVKVNTRFAIYRNGSYLADAVVQRVTADQSVAVVVGTVKQGETIQKGDVVQSGE